MSVGLTQPICMEMALSLLILPGVLCTNWLVVYQDVCAVRGSSVVIFCTYHYPEMVVNKNLTVEKVMWSQGRKQFFDGPFIIDSNNRTHTGTKFEYVGNKVHNCSLQIHQVEQRDSGEYAFRFETNNGGKWTGSNGAKVNISELIISMTTPKVHEPIKEGDCVNLTCMNNCSSAVMWFRNGKPLQEESSTLYLCDISFQDSGNYSCSPKHYNRPLSEVIRVNVEYGPRNPSVSVWPSSEVLEGSDVTLTCSSNANPTLNYTWFKIDGESCLEMVSQAELQLNVTHTGNSGKYFCVVSNKHGRQNSTILSLKVKDHAKGMAAVTLTILIAVLAVVPMIVILPMVAWHLVAHRKKTTAPKSDTEENTQTTEAHVTSHTSDCSLTEERREEEPSQQDEVIYTTVHTNTKQRANIQQQNEEATPIYSSIWEQQAKEDLYSVVSRPTPRGKQAQDDPVIYSAAIRTTPFSELKHHHGIAP
ncbi:B-cell receptor CD22 isoform X1 [Salmo trutta]|uniref:B-cell receptor CD22 isoform X1 n=1 Tax=Salmo trutta TaxID=8032 RepID=UPI0011300AB7|nr:B-cell receptor CD22-like isoform X1 [Salmo trutta]